MPCSPARARMLLQAGQAAILRRYPFTIMLRDRQGREVQPVVVKCDPGSETTGMALVAEFARRGRIVVSSSGRRRSTTGASRSGRRSRNAGLCAGPGGTARRATASRGS
ncbi:RRXRR domain-containing protein [Thermogemmatispora sp.]|uniref:RRXRR domain-containing protein n=1 Tax=Thermogemmatispora sp. TaxID=1968838 RepID=UPI0034301756